MKTITRKMAMAFVREVNCGPVEAWFEAHLGPDELPCCFDWDGDDEDGEPAKVTPFVDLLQSVVDALRIEPVKTDPVQEAAPELLRQCQHLLYCFKVAPRDDLLGAGLGEDDVDALCKLVDKATGEPAETETPRAC